MKSFEPFCRGRLLPVVAWLVLLATSACSREVPPLPAAVPKGAASTSPASGLTPDPSAHFDGKARELAAAAARGDVATVVRLVHDGHVDPNTLSKKGIPLLPWVATESGNLAGTRALLENGADPNRPTGRGENAMVQVARFSSPEIVALFARHGGDVDARNAIDEPLLIVAKHAGRWENVQALVEAGANVNALDKHMSPRSVLWEYSGGAFDKVLWLLQHGADPGLRQGKSINPERTGAQPILEEIFHRPMDAKAFPHLAEAQEQCRQWVLAHGHARPPLPDHLKKLIDQRRRSPGD